jgi:hypothetical protein
MPVRSEGATTKDLGLARTIRDLGKAASTYAFLQIVDATMQD